MKIIYVDCETTGLYPSKNELVQLAYIVELDGHVVEEVEMKCRPEKPDISEEALKVTGKTVEELMAYPDRKKQFKKFKKMLEKYIDPFRQADKFTWVGQNPKFDIDFLVDFFKQNKEAYFGSWFDRRAIDTIMLGQVFKYKGIWDPKNFKLGTMCEALGIELDAHDALNDIRATRELFKRFTDYIPAKEKQTV